MNYRQFFGRGSRTVAKESLGRLLVREGTDGGVTAGKIIETGAFEDGGDQSLRAGMTYAPGRIFVMSYRGNDFLNIATDREGVYSCVLIRKLALHDRVLDGPGKVGKFMNIENLDAEPLGKEIRIEGEGVPASRIERITDRISQNCLGYYRIK